MNKLIKLNWNINKIDKCSQTIEKAIRNGNWIELLSKQGQPEIIPEADLPEGPGFIIKGGGSSGKQFSCLQTCSNLSRSALSTEEWLIKQGINTKSCSLINPLPMNHVSGLMPWWRSKCWSAKHYWLQPSQLKSPITLEQKFASLLGKKDGPLLISLVPTQLHRLIYNQAGIRWLKAFTLIWVGGAFLSKELAQKARENNIKLAPCYGSTETAAMVTAMTPAEFLSGENDCGNPLNDVELSINKCGILKIKTTRLAIGKCSNGRIESICDEDGWWESGDIAQIKIENNLPRLKIEGRVDTAINSGGEIIFPEVLEERLLNAAKFHNIPLDKILLIPIDHEEWGQRLVAIVSLSDKYSNEFNDQFKSRLEKLVDNWLPAEKPLKWRYCNNLETTDSGKWERKKWEYWIINND